MPWKMSSPQLVDMFAAALPDNPRVERRKMFGYPAAFVNGTMFAGLHQDDVVVRLPEEQKEMLLREGGRRWEPMPGRFMKVYLLLPSDVEQAPLSRWLERSFVHVASLPARQKKAARPSSRKRGKK